MMAKYIKIVVLYSIQKQWRTSHFWGTPLETGVYLIKLLHLTHNFVVLCVSNVDKCDHL